MLLSKLVYLSIKNAIYQTDSSFTYESFMKGNFDNDIDFKMQIVNVFTPLNEAITRLSDLDRIPYRYEFVKLNGESVIDLTKLKHKVKEIAGVTDGSLAYNYKMFGDTLHLDRVIYNKEIIIEYKEDIKPFSEDDLVPLIDKQLGGYEDNNIDLNDYGINETMCNYIIEYVKGKLLEPIAPELANLHITTAETYFTNINPVKKSSIQYKVQSKYFIED